MLYLFPSPTIGDSLGHLSLGKGSIRNLKPKLGMPDNLFLIQSNGLKTKRSNNEKNPIILTPIDLAASLQRVTLKTIFEAMQYSKGDFLRTTCSRIF